MVNRENNPLEASLHSKLNHTAPNSPSLVASPSKRKTNMALNKIRSLGKLDLRSPLLTSNPLVSPAPEPFDDRSLHHSGASGMSLSKMISVIPETFYTMRNYYNDFTTIDWAIAFITTNRFQYELKKKRWFADQNSKSEGLKIPWYYWAYLQSGRWVAIVIIGLIFSVIAYAIDKTEILLVGFKHGFCSSNWFASQVECCYSDHEPKLQRNLFNSGYVFNTKSVSDLKSCPNWVSWSELFSINPLLDGIRLDFGIYVLLTVILAVVACIFTLSTKISGYHQTAHDSVKPSDSLTEEDFNEDASVKDPNFVEPKSLYTAAGSGVPEVKTILSGFVIRRFLGTKTLVTKTIALVLAIASGMSLGKEGPYVHLATSVGNIVTRLFPFIAENELLRKQVLSAAASSGVALAFGSPLGGVLFILEEINHTLPSHQLFLIFFCAITSTLFLKFLNPYGTGKTVLFELNYSSDWNPLELVFFVMIGIAGGIFGAAFIKFVGWWPKVFRSHKSIKNRPIFEVLLVALVTGAITFWNPYTKQATSELVLDLATPCSGSQIDSSLCPTSSEEFSRELASLSFAFVVKVILTFITFGLKLPCGIYVPSMVIGALFGRIFSMFIQYLNLSFNYQDINNPSAMAGIMRGVCSSNPEAFCVDLGIYSMISAGAFMAGVTRMNIALVTILFELTSTYTYVLPISVAIAVANFVGHALEPKSLYESLLIANDYPFLPPETEALDPFTTAGQIVTEADKYDDDKIDNVDTIEAVKSSTPATPAFMRNSVFLYHSNLYSNALDSNDNNKLYVDISSSPYVSMHALKSKLSKLAENSLLDGCIPLIKNHVCVGMIFFPDLEFCVDRVEEFCLQNKITGNLYFKVYDEDKYFNNTQHVEVLQNHRQHNFGLLKSQLISDPEEIDYFNYGSTRDAEAEEVLYDQLSSEVAELTDLTSFVNYSPIFINYDSELSLAHLIFDKIGNRVLVLLKDGKYHGVLHKKTLIDYTRRGED